MAVIRAKLGGYAATGCITSSWADYSISNIYEYKVQTSLLSNNSLYNFSWSFVFLYNAKYQDREFTTSCATGD